MILSEETREEIRASYPVAGIFLLVISLVSLPFIAMTAQFGVQNQPSAMYHGSHAALNLDASSTCRVFASDDESLLGFSEDETGEGETSENENATSQSEEDEVNISNQDMEENTTLPVEQGTVESAKKTNQKIEAPIVTNRPVLDVSNSLGIAAGGGLVFMSQGDLDIYFRDLKDLGVEWVRWDVDWAVVQPYDFINYSWEATDRVVATAQKYGIRSLGIIAYSPQWAQKGICPSEKQCAPASPVMYARFASAVAERYRGKIDYWEIWNEPNLTGFWYPKPSMESYAEILKASYVAIKKVNPNAVVMTGGLSAADDDKEGNISPITFIKSLYILGAKNYFDAVALHPYTYPVLADYDACWSSWQHMLSIRKIMEANGDTAKRIWATEYGAPTGGPGSKRQSNFLEFTYGSDHMSEASQDEMARVAFSLYRNNSDWMGPFFWYSLHDNGDENSTPENFFGLVRYDGSRKPAYITIRSIFNPGN
jgi:hypothetical protein